MILRLEKFVSRDVEFVETVFSFASTKSINLNNTDLLHTDVYMTYFNSDRFKSTFSQDDGVHDNYTELITSGNTSDPSLASYYDFIHVPAITQHPE